MAKKNSKASLKRMLAAYASIVKIIKSFSAEEQLRLLNAAAITARPDEESKCQE